MNAKALLIFGIVYILGVVIVGTLQWTRNNTIKQTSLVVRENLGQPSHDQTLPQFSLLLQDPNMVIFVCMTSKPERLHNVSRSLAAVPEDYRIRKLLVLPQTQKDSTHENAEQDPGVLHGLHVGNRVQVLRTSKDMGPILKVWALSDPATSVRLGILRTQESRHIFITLDDDMQYHQDLVQDLVNRIVETKFQKVVAAQTRQAEASGQSQPQIIGRSGVAQPARIWTSAFRGDVRDAFLNAPCTLDDDACISQSLQRNSIGIETLHSKKQALESSVGTNYDSPSLKSDLCEKVLSRLPIL